MKTEITKILDQLLADYPELALCKDEIAAAYLEVASAFESGRTLYCCGNGGSAADCSHIVGELRKRFMIPRPISKELAGKLAAFPDGAFLASTLERALPAVSLCDSASLLSATANDRSPEAVYAQALFGLAKQGDILLAISTSGNAKNCLYAAELAKALSVKVIALTGSSGGALAKFADVAIKVPRAETYRVQELHLPVYHALCRMLETHFFC